MSQPRIRDYKVYGALRGGPFTTRTVAYSRHTHPYVYEVRAQSIKQAYWLAAHERWAEVPRGVGVQKLYDGERHVVIDTVEDRIAAREAEDRRRREAAALEAEQTEARRAARQAKAEQARLEAGMEPDEWRAHQAAQRQTRAAERFERAVADAAQYVREHGPCSFREYAEHTTPDVRAALEDRGLVSVTGRVPHETVTAVLTPPAPRDAVLR